MVPGLDDEPWPTLGPQVCAFIEEALIHGPGDLRGEPARLDDEKRALICRLYEIYPKEHALGGRRRFRRAALSLRKGVAKTELAAWVAAVELHPDAPVRCVGWDGDEPIGGSVTDPYIPLIAYTEEQRGVFSFCMCPGGQVVPSEQPGQGGVARRPGRAEQLDAGLEHLPRLPEVAAGVEYTAERVERPDGSAYVRALRDGEPITVRPAAELSECLVATGFAYEREVREGQALAVARLVPRIRRWSLAHAVGHASPSEIAAATSKLLGQLRLNLARKENLLKPKFGNGLTVAYHGLNRGRVALCAYTALDTAAEATGAGYTPAAGVGAGLF